MCLRFRIYGRAPRIKYLIATESVSQLLFSAYKEFGAKAATQHPTSLIRPTTWTFLFPYISRTSSNPLIDLFISAPMARRRVADDKPAPAKPPPPVRNTCSRNLVGPDSAKKARLQSDKAPEALIPPAKNTRSQSKGNSNHEQELRSDAPQNNNTDNVTKMPSPPSYDVPLSKTGPPRGKKRAAGKVKQQATPHVPDNSDGRARSVILNLSISSPWCET